MSYRDSPNYQEAQRRLQRKARCHTPLGRYWNHHEFIAALKALLAEHHKTGVDDAGRTPVR